MSFIDILDGLSHAIEVVTHPRFYMRPLGGIAVAAALWRWMPAGDIRDAVAGPSILAGFIVGVVWDCVR